MTIKKLIEEAYERQLRYGLTTRAKDVKRFASYIIEEAVEISREITWGADRYKPFKPSKPINEQALAEEIADLIIHAFNVAAVSEIPAEIIEQAVKNKLQYNETRVDHLEKK